MSLDSRYVSIAYVSIEPLTVARMSFKKCFNFIFEQNLITLKAIFEHKAFKKDFQFFHQFYQNLTRNVKIFHFLNKKSSLFRQKLLFSEYFHL
jgi:hypothetical protein